MFVAAYLPLRPGFLLLWVAVYLSQKKSHEVFRAMAGFGSPEAGDGRRSTLVGAHHNQLISWLRTLRSQHTVSCGSIAGRSRRL
jgi:hypothetical protein